MIVAGSPGMYGAAILASKAAARVGSGYVKLLTDLRTFPIHKQPDFLLIDKNIKKPFRSEFDALAIGPGLGTGSFSRKIFREVLKLKKAKIVFDADALNLLAKEKKFKLAKTWILTPHEAELARLLGTTAKWVRENRMLAVQTAQKKFSCIVILKGHQTLIAAENEVFKNSTGNASLAKAGTGDVLTGILCGFLAQGLSSLDAAKLAVYVHGFIADEWVKKRDVLSMMASDLVEMLPYCLKKLRKR